MPYIYKNKEVKNPGAPYDYKLVQSYTDIAGAILELEREIVGVKLIYDKEIYDTWDVEEPKNKYSYCQMIRDGSQGKMLKSRLEHHMCDGATTALALEDSNPHIENGSEYFSYDLYASPGSAKRMRSSIKSLHHDMGLTYGVVTGPIKSFTKEAPDIVLLIEKPYAIMRLTQGYVYHHGNKPSIDYGAMQALCSEMTVVPYLTGEMNISALCPSTRMLASWGEDEMGIGIPFESYIDTIDGVMATSKATDSVPKRKSILEKLKDMDEALIEFYKQ